MKFYYPVIILFLVIVHGCSQAQKTQPLTLIPGEQWQQVLRLKESGQLKAAEDSLLQMIAQNVMYKKGARYPDFYSSIREEFNNRHPYWEVRKFSQDSLNYIKATLSATVGYLQQLKSLSPATVRKLERSIASGVVYTPVELFFLANALSKSETALKSSAGLTDLQKMTNHGFFKAADLRHIVEDIQNGDLNQVSEVLNKYGQNILHIECPQHVTDEQQYLRELLNKILSQLSFHQSHSIESIQFVKMEEWPGRGYDPYTLIHLVFNGRPYYICFSTATFGYRLSKHVYIEFLPSLLHTLAKDFGQTLQAHVVPAYYLDFVSASNSNITGYNIFLTPYITPLWTKNIFYDHEIGSDETFESPDKREEYLNKILSVLDRHWEKPVLDSLHFRAKWFAIPTDSEMLLQLPGTTHTVWEDDLNEEASSPFEPVFNSLNDISGGRLKGYAVRGNCANIDEGENYKLELTFKQHRYTTILRKGDYVDYHFIKLIRQLQDEEDLGGQFYYLPLNNIEDGYTFIFLTKEEVNRLQQHPYFSVTPLEKFEKFFD
jgi:hypothetical protein